MTRIVLFNPATGQTQTFAQAAVLLGRSPECDLKFDNTQVSRRHAELRLREGRCFIIDLASKNGVFLNNQGLAASQGAELHAGDEIRLGNATGPTLIVREIGSTLSDTMASGAWEDDAPAESIGSPPDVPDFAEGVYASVVSLPPSYGAPASAKGPACANCGYLVSAGNAFCLRCGSPLQALRDSTNAGDNRTPPTLYMPPAAPPMPQSAPPPVVVPPPPLPMSAPPKAARGGGFLTGLGELASRAWQNLRGSGEAQPAPPKATATTMLAPPALSSQNESDIVDCAVYAPPQARRGASFLVQVFAHLPEMAEVARALAQEFDQTATRRGCQTLAVAIEYGARLDFHLTMPGLEVEHPGYSLIWRKKVASVQFAVRVPDDRADGDALGKVTVSLAGRPVGHINFKVTVTAQTAGRQARQTGESHAYRRAFLSYANEDRFEVGKRAQMLAPLKIGLDHDALDAGTRQAGVDFRRIDESDLFLLFWSDAARRSPLVLQEVEYALHRQRDNDAATPEIMPVVLQGPPVPPPPESLAQLSFDDYLPYFDSSNVPTIPDETAPENWSDPLGRLLNNRYFVEERIGAGGFGEVYRARDEQLVARPVVVKTLRAEGLQNPWVTHKFRHEIEALARLDHPAIVGIFDAGQMPGGMPFLVMQFVNGQSLRQALPPAGLDLAEASGIIRQVASALDEAHAKGILHRDLKPENIMLRRLQTGETQAVVIDFGIAKVRNSALAPATDDGRVAGTYLYMSPEQLLGEPLNAASDIYSLGVVAYEILTGRRPFAPGSLAQLPQMQRRQMFDAPCQTRPEIPPAAQAALLQALEYDPARRYPTAHHFGEALAQGLAA